MFGHIQKSELNFYTIFDCEIWTNVKYNIKK